MTNLPVLPYDPEVDTWGNRSIVIDNQTLTYEEACRRDRYVDIALGIETDNAKTDESIPIEFTQFVLRKMAAIEKGSRFDESLLHPKAKQYFEILLGDRTFKMREVHARNADLTSTFRGIFTNVFCKKVIMNFKNVEDNFYDQFARRFPFVIRKNVSDYNIHVLNCYDNSFYTEIQQFLNEHFNNIEARQITKLFLNNIRDFRLSGSPNNVNYLDSFPRLTDTGIAQYQALQLEYHNVRKHFRIFSLPDLRSEIMEENSYQYFYDLPETNIEDLFYLLESIKFRTDYRIYINKFKKYLFHFVHALQEEKNEVFFIEDVTYHCLKSLKRYKTVQEDITMIKDIAAIALLNTLMFENEFKSGNRYYINISALEKMKNYILTELVNEKNAQLSVTFDRFDVTVYTSIVVEGAVVKIQYSQSDRNIQRGIRDLLHCTVVALLSPDDNPIKCLITYNAFTGEEKKFTIPDDLRASLTNFIRLSIK